MKKQYTEPSVSLCELRMAALCLSGENIQGDNGNSFGGGNAPLRR